MCIRWYFGGALVYFLSIWNEPEKKSVPHACQRLETQAYWGDPAVVPWTYFSILWPALKGKKNTTKRGCSSHQAEGSRWRHIYYKGHALHSKPLLSLQYTDFVNICSLFTMREIRHSFAHSVKCPYELRKDLQFITGWEIWSWMHEATLLTWVLLFFSPCLRTEVWGPTWGSGMPKLELHRLPLPVQSSTTRLAAIVYSEHCLYSKAHKQAIAKPQTVSMYWGKHMLQSGVPHGSLLSHFFPPVCTWSYNESCGCVQN